MDITLTNHVGTTITGETVEVGQWIVHVDGQQVGYLQKREGAWLQSIVPMTDEQKTEVMAAVSKQAKQKIGGVAAVPLPLDDEDDDE